MDFGERLKNLRTLSGESQKYLANVLQVSDVMVSQYENGKKMPGRTTLKKIATHYNITLAELLGDTPSDLSDEIIILNRAMMRMPQEKQRKILSIIKLIYEEDFIEQI